MADDGELLELFENAHPASWTVRGDTLVFPILTIREHGGNRNVKRERPYRDGWKVDDTGSQGKTFTLEAVFENSIDEPGIPTDRPLYPMVVNDLIESFDYHETGDLVLPIRGAVRARADTYDRTENFEERDGCRVTFNFITDNEDNVDARTFTAPSIRARAIRLAGDTRFGMEGMGGFTQLLSDLSDAADSLEVAIAAPGEMLQDVDEKAQKLVRIVQGVEEQFTRSGQLGRDLLLQPDSWATVRQMRILQDRSEQAFGEKSPFATRIVTKSFSRDLSIWDIGVETGQNPAALLAINTGLDPFHVPAGTPVRVFEE